MYFKRKAYDKLLEWKNLYSDKYSVLLEGARRVGKSTIAENFAKNEYKSYILIDFSKTTGNILECFDDIGNLNIFFLRLQAETGITLYEHESLIIFDEVQRYPQARELIKYLVQDGRYDYLETGSLISLKVNIENIVIPSEEEHIEMFPMDFEEFLWAKGYGDDTVENLLSHMKEFNPFSELEMNVFHSLFLDYNILGGMPAVVAEYIERNTFEGSLDTQKQLIADYKEDIRKYATGIDQTRIINVFNRVAPQLARENKKFQISKVASGARFRDYRGCAEWLSDAGMVNICYCMEFPELPLGGNYEPDTFKLYFADTGLLVSMLDDESQEDLRANKNLGVYKGDLYENMVGEALIKQGYKLFYYKKEDSTLEASFFIRSTASLIPVEVKAKSGRAKSMKTLITSDHYPDIRYGIKLSKNNIGHEDRIYTFPYFCTFLLKRFMAGFHAEEEAE